ncbi:MAG: glycosyltransferase [Gemmatimonadetes bacterium]|nr:glycosyltransferase [Gemmatimonadota bacterium]MBA4159018.1 glycosyltransferase [Gemmatimonadota bacterium]
MQTTVMHYTDTVGFGGAERMLLATLAGLDRQRWRPVLLHYANPSAVRLAEEAQRLDVETRVVPSTGGLAKALELAQLARMLHAERTAVLHAHLAWPLRCTRGLLAAKLARVPAVIATQQLFAELHSRRARLKHRTVAAGVDRYIAVSREMERAMRPLVPRRRLSVVPNGIRVHDFARTRSPATRAALLRSGERALVLTVARLDWQKGLDQLLQAAALVPGVRFVIAGEGAERARLEREATALGIADRVDFLGERSDVPDLLASADLFVLPSLIEGLPVSVLEAMAAGVPVVATDVPGTREAVQDGETGVLVQPGDPPALARAIRRLLEERSLAARLAEAGRCRVRREFSVEAMVGRVMGIYEEVLASSGRQHAGR